MSCLDNKPAPTPFSNGLNAIDHTLPVMDGLRMVDNFIANRETMLSQAFQGNNTLPVSETFNLKTIQDLICQYPAVGFRVYLGLDDNNQVRIILVGADSDGKDIIQRTRETPGGLFPGASTMCDEAGQRWP